VWSIGTVLLEMIAGQPPPLLGENHIDVPHNIQDRSAEQ
jgi:hypothetical protein